MHELALLLIHFWEKIDSMPTCCNLAWRYAAANLALGGTPWPTLNLQRICMSARPCRHTFSFKHARHQLVNVHEGLRHLLGPAPSSPPFMHPELPIFRLLELTLGLRKPRLLTPDPTGPPPPCRKRKRYKRARCPSCEVAAHKVLRLSFKGPITRAQGAVTGFRV
jgi:hypothetical protein